MFGVAKEWCDRNPKWQRICDIEDSDSLALSWAEVPNRMRRPIEQMFGDSAERIWIEFSPSKPYRHRFGFVAEDGTFYDSICDVPINTNSVMVFQTGGPTGVYYRGGKHERSSRAVVKISESTAV